MTRFHNCQAWGERIHNSHCMYILARFTIINGVVRMHEHCELWILPGFAIINPVGGMIHNLQYMHILTRFYNCQSWRVGGDSQFTVCMHPDQVSQLSILQLGFTLYMLKFHNKCLIQSQIRNSKKIKLSSKLEYLWFPCLQFVSHTCKVLQNLAMDLQVL